MNNSEHKLIRLLLDKDFWEDNKGHITRNFFPGDLATIFDTIERAHSEFERSFTLDEIRTLVMTWNPMLTRATKTNIYELLQTIDEDEPLGPDVAREVLHDMFRKDVFRQIADLGLDGMEGRLADLQPLSRIIETHDENFMPVSDCEPVTNDFDEVWDALDARQCWRFNIPTLAKYVPGGAGGDFAVLFARPECYMPNTEVLTEDGWTRFDKLATGTKVAQVNEDRSLTFVYPTAFIQRPHRGPVYTFKDGRGRVNITVTDKHDMVYEQDGALHKEGADVVRLRQGRKLHTAPVSSPNGVQYHITALERLLIAFAAYGSMYKEPNTGGRCGCRTVRIGLKKDRKVERLLSILSDLGWEWYKSSNCNGQGTYTYYIKWPLSADYQPSKKFDWVAPHTRSSEWCKSFVDELSYWDATHRTETRYKYDTTCEESADVAATVAVLAGYSVYWGVQKDKRGYKVINSLNIRTVYEPIDGQSIRKEEHYYEGQVYCVTVPSGMLLVRSNRHTLVSGNCGKTALHVSLTCAPGGFLSQGANVLTLVNEEPAIRTRARGITAVADMSREQVMQNRGAAKAMWDAVKDQWTLFDDVDMTIDRLDAICKRRKPDVLIVDQLDKVGVFGNYARQDQRLREIYKRAREIAKRHDIFVIGISQASADAEGKTKVTYAMMEESKTGKAAEADLIIGVGKRPTDENSNGEEDKIRYLTASKNKITGWHGTIGCVLEGEKSIYRA